jgi:hypothetical protein
VLLLLLLLLLSSPNRSVSYFCGLTDSLLDEARRRALHSPQGDDARLDAALLTVRVYDQGWCYVCVVEEEDPKGLMAANVTVGGATVQCSGAAVLRCSSALQRPSLASQPARQSSQEKLLVLASAFSGVACVGMRFV